MVASAIQTMEKDSENRYQLTRKMLASIPAEITVDNYCISFSRVSRWGASHNLESQEGRLNELFDSWLVTAASMDRQLNTKLIQIRAALKKCVASEKLRVHIKLLNAGIDEINKIKDRNARVTKYIRSLTQGAIPQEQFQNNFIL